MNTVEVILKGTDELSGPAKSAQAGLNGLSEITTGLHSTLANTGEAFNGLATHLKEVESEAHPAKSAIEGTGEAARTSGEHATEAEGRFTHFRESLAETGKIAAGLVAGQVFMSMFSGLGEQFKEVTTGVADYSEQVRQLSVSTGMTTEASSHLILAMKDTNTNVDVGIFGISNFAKVVGQSQIALEEHTKMIPPALKALDQMGISIRDENGGFKDQSTLLGDVADKFNGMDDSQDKARWASVLFKGSWQDMLPLLNLGSEGLREVAENADKYGVTLTAANVGAVRQFVTAHKDMDAAIEGVRIRLGNALIPVLTSLVEHLTTGVTNFQKWLTTLNDTYHITDIVSEAMHTIGQSIEDAYEKAREWSREHAFGDWAAGTIGYIAVVVSGLGTLASAFAEVFGDILAIVVSVGQMIYAAFSWLDPGAPHSPPLVQRVADGVAAINSSFGELATSGQVMEELGKGPLKDLGDGINTISKDGKSSMDDLSKAIGSMVTEADNHLKDLTTQLTDAKSALADFSNAPIAGEGASNDAIQQQQQLIDQTQLALDKAQDSGGLGAAQGLGADLARSKDQLAEMGKATKGNADAMNALKFHISEVTRQLADMKSAGSDTGDLKNQLELQQQHLKVLQDQAKVDFGPLKYQQKELADQMDPSKAEKPWDVIKAGILDSGSKIQTLTPQIKAQQAAVDQLKGAWDAVKEVISNLQVPTGGAGGGGGKGAGGAGAGIDPIALAKKIGAPFGPEGGIGGDKPGGISEAVQKSIADAQTKMAGFTDTINKMSDSIKGMQPALESFGNTVKTMQPAFDAFGQAVKVVFDYIGAHQEIISFVVGAFVGWRVAILPLVGIITGLAGVIETVLGVAGAMGAIFEVAAGAEGVGAFATAAGGIVALLGGPVTLVIVGIVALVALLAVAWANNWGDIHGKVAAVVEFLSTLPTKIGGFFNEVGIKVREVGTFFDNLGTTVQIAIGNMVAWIDQHWRLITVLLTGPIGLAVVLLANHWDAISGKVSSAWEAVHGFIVEWTGKINSTVDGWISKLEGLIGGIKDWIVAKYKDFKDASNQLGDNIGQGILDGIKAHLPGVLQAAGGLAGSIISTVEERLKNASPSKEMMQQGKWAAQGLEVGMAQETPYVADAARKMTTQGLQPITDGTGVLANTLRSTVANAFGEYNNTLRGTQDVEGTTVTSTDKLTTSLNTVGTTTNSVVDLIGKFNSGLATSQDLAAKGIILGVNFTAGMTSIGSAASDFNKNDPYAIGIGIGGQSPNQGPKSPEDIAAANAMGVGNWQAAHNQAIGLTATGSAIQRAFGGPVYPGQTYTVGESGIETLMMGARGGYVIPNNGGGANGGGMYVNVNVNLPSGSVMMGTAAELAGTVRTELLKLKRTVPQLGLS